MHIEAIHQVHWGLTLQNKHGRIARLVARPYEEGTAACRDRAVIVTFPSTFSFLSSYTFLSACTPPGKGHQPDPPLFVSAASS